MKVQPVRRTIYCVQPFVLAGERFEPGERLLFLCASEAEEWCERRPDTCVGATISRVRGYPHFDTWDEPEWLMTVGLVPRPHEMVEVA